MSNHTVAVYGSLRQGLHNHRLLTNAEYLGTDNIPGFDMYSMGGFPFLKPSDTEAKTVIEVYNVTDDEFTRLDHLEGYPSFYDRKQVPTKHGDAWIYFIDEPSPIHDKVENRDWKQYYTETRYAY